jgi:hypothetical protein
VQQISLDPEDDNDWALDVTIDLGKSRAAARPVLELIDVVS